MLFITALKPNFYVQYYGLSLPFGLKHVIQISPKGEKIGIKLLGTWLAWKSLIASVEDSVRVLSLYLDAISMNSKFWEVNKNLYQIRQSMFYPQQVCLVNLSLFTVST